MIRRSLFGRVLRVKRAFGRVAASVQKSLINEKGRAIGTNDLILIAHVDEDVRMIERRQFAYTRELLSANPYPRNTWSIVKIGNAIRSH
jgi:hypothetical protein